MSPDADGAPLEGRLNLARAALRTFVGAAPEPGKWEAELWRFLLTRLRPYQYEALGLVLGFLPKGAAFAGVAAGQLEALLAFLAEYDRIAKPRAAEATFYVEHWGTMERKEGDQADDAADASALDLLDSTMQSPEVHPPVQPSAAAAPTNSAPLPDLVTLFRNLRSPFKVAIFRPSSAFLFTRFCR